jgi:hypothetical protein
MLCLRIYFYPAKKTLYSSFTELVPERAVSLEPSVAGDDVLHLGQEPAVNLSNESRFSQLDGIHQQKDAKYQCCGSMTFWCGSGSRSMPLTNGSGSCYFRHRPSRCQQKTKFFFFCLFLFDGTFSSFFKDKKSKRVTK